MNLFLTSTGFEKNREIAKEFLKFINKEPSKISVFLVNTARERSKEWKYVKLTLQALEGIGIKKQNVTVFSLNKKTQETKLNENDVIYVCGGNTFSYLDKIKKTGFDEKIKEFVKKGGLYFGISAGSYIVCPTIETAYWKPADNNNINLKNLSGLNLVPFLIVAHFQEKYRSDIKKKAIKMNYPVIALNDYQAIVIKNRKVKVIGPGKRNVFNTSNIYNILEKGK